MGRSKTLTFQRGFVPILVIIAAVILLAGGGFYLLSNKNPATVEEHMNQQNSSPDPGVGATPMPSPKSSPKAKGIPINVTTTISTAKPTSSPAINGPTPAPEIIINAAGSYTYSGQEIKYAISFPKNGGNVSGTVSGVCNGPIKGNFTGGDGGSINSNVDAECQIGILKQPLNADFEGKVYFSQGRADLEWQGSIPFYSGSKEFSLTFTPL